MKKILYVAGRVSVKNGAFHSLKTLVSENKKFDIEQTVLLCRHGKEEEILKNMGIKCWVIPYCSCTVPANKKSRIKGKIKTLINKVLELYAEKKIKKEKFDLIHINVSTVDFCAKSAFKYQIPLVWHLREFLESDVNMTYINQKKMKEMLNKATAIISITDEVGNHFKQTYDIKNPITIYNGISLKNNVEQNNYDNNMENYTIVGRIIKEKGQLDAVKAIGKLVEKRPLLKLNIVGDIDNYEYYNEIKNFIQKNSLENNIVFYEHQSDLEEIWRKTDVGLICSKKEGFGRVTAEFMLNNKLVIGSNTGGTRELLNYQRGILYEEGNYLDLAHKIEFVINNKEICKKIRNNGYQFSKSNFTSELYGFKINQVYENILNRGR